MSEPQKGKISVETENIFPIIKKWLYSEKDIFLRELVSNASDAITKLKKISLSEEFDGGNDYRIDITMSKDSKTISISDNGIGMSEEEVNKYINQIAFSGASDFAQRFQKEGNQGEIIGHFGLGFYSSFMVSTKVTIETLSYKKGSEAVRWESEGGVEYQISKTKKEGRGTVVTLHLDSENEEYLDAWKVKELIKKYCDFLPVSIYVDGEKANKEKALWSETPTSIKDKDYEDFYQYLFPFSPNSIFHIHLNVDYPFRLTGILYFPKLTHELEAAKNGIKLYCNHVFVSDDANELIPQFLTVLKGTIDIPDLPLNVSRSYLQNDPLVKKISQHIIKKVADRLVEDFKYDRSAYEKNWPFISIFVKFGVVTEEKFYEAVKPALIFHTSEDKYMTIDEYLDLYKDKNQNKVYYANESDKSSVYMDLMKSQGITSILLDSKFDTHVVQFLEGKYPEVKFQRVDSEIADSLVDKDASPGVVDKDNKTESDRILDFFKASIGKDGLEIKVQTLKSNELPGVIVIPEFLRRMSEMNSMMNQSAALDMLKNHTLIVNSASPMVKSALKNYEGMNPERGKQMANIIYEMSLLGSKSLNEEGISRFIKRVATTFES
jgi:molecular chaperone HtpG